MQPDQRPNCPSSFPSGTKRRTCRSSTKQLTAALTGFGRPYEILLIDDGSTDASGKILAEMTASDWHVRVIRFRRNFGQTAGFSAGFAYARGRIIITADGDLQNDPARHSRDGPEARERNGRPRHRLRLAQGPQGQVADAPRARRSWRTR